MAANRFGIDVGQLYRDTEAVKGARTRNALSTIQLGEAEREIAERPERQRVATERKNVLTDLRGKSAGGDIYAQQQLLSLDPEGAPSFLDAVSKMDVRKVAATKKTVDEIGKLSAYVLQAKTPEEQQRRYTLMRGGVGHDVQSKLPEQYDPQFVELSLSKSMAMDKILANPKAISFAGEDRLYKSGREIERAQRPVKAVAGEGGQGGLKSGDESLMYRQSAELLGGLFDQAGNITNLDPTVRNKVQGIATEATKIFQQGSVTRTQAVKMAAQKFGLDVQEPGAINDINPNDPLGIRN